jgi:hypothetical protein
MADRALAVFLLAVVAFASVACGATEKSSPVIRPFANSGGLESGMTGAGDGPSTPTGEHLRCWNGRRYAQNTTLRNTSTVPVTLTGVDLGAASTPLVRRVAVQFRLAPPPPTGDQLVVGLRGWSQSAASPTKIPPGRSAWVQSNFEISHCGLLRSGDTAIANRTMKVTYRANSTDGSQRITMTSARIILTGEPVVPASTQDAIRHHVPSNVAYVPIQAPAGWRYVSWDSGRETPGLFPQGKGLNIWFSETPSRTPVDGFHVYPEDRCSMKGAMKKYNLDGVSVGWSATYEDSQAWRCVTSAHSALVTILVSGNGTNNDPPQVVNRRAKAMAEMVGTARPVK